MMLMWGHAMFLFTDFVPYPQIRFKLGYWLLTLIGMTVLVNIAYLYKDEPRRMNLLGKKLLKQHNHDRDKKKRKKKE